MKQIQASLAASNLFCEISLDGTKLYEENIMLIESKTNPTRLEIKEQFQEFITFCPSGSFSKERLVRILKNILPEKSVKIAVDQIFENFDKDGKDDIDFTEFIIGCHNFNTEEKLHWVFQLFHSDQSGFIQLKEMVE